MRSYQINGKCGIAVVEPSNGTYVLKTSTGRELARGLHEIAARKHAVAYAMHGREPSELVAWSVDSYAREISGWHFSIDFAADEWQATVWAHIRDKRFAIFGAVGFFACPEDAMLACERFARERGSAEAMAAFLAAMPAIITRRFTVDG